MNYADEQGKIAQENQQAWKVLGLTRLTLESSRKLLE
jgi:hypothetical protein